MQLLVRKTIAIYLDNQVALQVLESVDDILESSLAAEKLTDRMKQENLTSLGAWAHWLQKE